MLYDNLKNIDGIGFGIIDPNPNLFLEDQFYKWLLSGKIYDIIYEWVISGHKKKNDGQKKEDLKKCINHFVEKDPFDFISGQYISDDDERDSAKKHFKSIILAYLYVARKVLFEEDIKDINHLDNTLFTDYNLFMYTIEQCFRNKLQLKFSVIRNTVLIGDNGPTMAKLAFSKLQFKGKSPQRDVIIHPKYAMIFLKNFMILSKMLLKTLSL